MQPRSQFATGGKVRVALANCFALIGGSSWSVTCRRSPTAIRWPNDHFLTSATPTRARILGRQSAEGQNPATIGFTGPGSRAPALRRRVSATSLNYTGRQLPD